MTAPSGIQVTRDDGSVVSIPQHAVEAMPHTVMLGIYVKAASYADGAWYEDLLGPQDVPNELRRTIRPMVEDLGLLRLEQVHNHGHDEVYRAIGAEVIA